MRLEARLITNSLARDGLNSTPDWEADRLGDHASAGHVHTLAEMTAAPAFGPFVGSQSSAHIINGDDSG